VNNLILIIILFFTGCSSAPPIQKREISSEASYSCIDLTRALFLLNSHNFTKPKPAPVANPISNPLIEDLEEKVSSQQNQLVRLKIRWRRSQGGGSIKTPEAVEKEIKSLLTKSLATRKQLSSEKLKLALAMHLADDDFEILQKFKDGRDVNQKYFSGPESSPPFMEDVPAVHIRLKKSIRLLRVHNSNEDGYKGSWFMQFHDKSIWEMSPNELIDILALPSSNSSQSISVIEINAGDEFILGSIGEQINAPGEAGATVFGFSGFGGQLQYWRLPEKNVNGILVKQPWLTANQVKEKTEIFNSKQLNEMRFNIRNASTKEDLENVEDDLHNYMMIQKSELERHSFTYSIQLESSKILNKRLDVIRYYIKERRKELLQGD
jgi:hypothetical protein